MNANLRTGRLIHFISLPPRAPQRARLNRGGALGGEALRCGIAQRPVGVTGEFYFAQSGEFYFARSEEVYAAIDSPGSTDNWKPTTAPLFRVIMTRAARRSYRAETASNWRLIRAAERKVIASNSSDVGFSNSAMIPTPFCADDRKPLGDANTDLTDFASVKSDLLQKPDWAVWAVQFILGPPSPRLDGVDMGWRVIVGVDCNADGAGTGKQIKDINRLVAQNGARPIRLHTAGRCRPR